MPHTQSQEGLQQEVIVQSTTTSSDHVYIPGVPSWIATLLTVVGLIIAAVALSLAVSGQPVTAPAPEPTPALEVPPPPPAAQPAVGPLMAGADPILPLPAEGLAPYAGRTVHGNAVPVQSVVADEGFWVGTSETDRVYVIYRTGGGESPPDVDAGQLVNFVGSLQPATAEVDAPQFRLTEAEGLGQLRSQGYFVGVPSVDVVVDGPEQPD